MTSLTPKEQTCLGRLVVAKKDIDYPHKKIRENTRGKIIDFAKSDGIPCIQWDDGSKYKGFCYWDSIVIK